VVVIYTIAVIDLDRVRADAPNRIGSRAGAMLLLEERHRVLLRGSLGHA